MKRNCTKLNFVFPLSFVGLLGVAGLAHADSYTTTLIDYPGSRGTILRGINDLGQVIGLDSLGHSFSYNDGAFTSISVPGSTTTTVIGINNLGQIVGEYLASGAGGFFLYSNGVYSNLGISLPGSNVIPEAINDAGQIAGYIADNSGWHGFIYANGIVTIFNTPDNQVLRITKINNAGQVVGEYGQPSEETSGHAFLYSNGSLTTLPFSSAASINNQGQILIPSGDILNSDDTRSTAPQPILPTNLAYSQFADFNNAGQFIGIYQDSQNSSYHGFLLTPTSIMPTPEPSSLFLLVSGLSGLALLSRVKRKPS